MNTVGIRRDGQIGPVIDDQQHVVSGEPLGGGEDRAVGFVLHPKLNDVDPTAHGGAQKIVRHRPAHEV
jgi:hypothetical protein